VKSFLIFPMKCCRRTFALILAGCVLGGALTACGANPQKTKELVAVLQSQASLFEKARACQQLGEIGTAEAVPSLAQLLGDEHLSAYARSGLEGIPDPAAAAALRTALGTVKGRLLAGVVNSLGVLRDSQAVAALRALAEDPASGVSSEALLALGRIANGQCIAILRHNLAAGPEALRADAAAACLLAAEKQLADGHADTAAALYDAVRSANMSPVYRVAATRGAILARRSGAVEFLMEQLRGEDPVGRDAALLTIREMPGPALADALNDELGKAGPGLELQLLRALADCHNGRSLKLLEARTTAADPEIRKTALKVLAGLTGPAQAGVLLKIFVEDRSADEIDLAGSALENLQGPTLNTSVLRALKSAREPNARARLIGLLNRRGATSAAGELLKQAADPDEAVSLAAFGALASLAGANEMPALIALTKVSKDEQTRDAAEEAVCRTAASTGTTGMAGAAVLTELDRSVDPAQKNAWIRILTSLGYTNALPAVEAAMKDSNKAVAANAIETLGNWPDPGPIDAILAVVETEKNSKLRQSAFASVIQLARVAADEHQRPDEIIIGWLERANPAAQAVAEQRQLISVLGRLKRPESFRLLSRWLDHPDVQAEAAVAVVQIAPALVDSPNSSALKTALEKIAASSSNADLCAQATKLAQSIRSN
jgi:HEAT repeat protein